MINVRWGGDPVILAHLARDPTEAQENRAEGPLRAMPIATMQAMALLSLGLACLMAPRRRT